MLRPLTLVVLANSAIAAVLSPSAPTITPQALLPRADSVYGWYVYGSLSGSTLWNPATYSNTVTFTTSGSLYGFCYTTATNCQLWRGCSSGYIFYGTTSSYCGTAISTCSYDLLYSSLGASNPLTGFWCNPPGYTGVVVYQQKPTDSAASTSPSSPSSTTPTTTTTTTTPKPGAPTTPSSPVATSPIPNPIPSPKPSNIKAIVGGVVGGIALIGAIVIALVLILRKKKSSTAATAPPPPPVTQYQQQPPAQYPPAPQQGFQPQPPTTVYPVAGAAPLPPKTAETYAVPVAQNQDPHMTQQYYPPQGNGFQSPVTPGSPAPQYEAPSPTPQYQAWQQPRQAPAAHELPESTQR